MNPIKRLLCWFYRRHIPITFAFPHTGERIRKCCRCGIALK